MLRLIINLNRQGSTLHLPDPVESWVIKLESGSSYNANESLPVQVTLWSFTSVENAPLHFLVASTCSADISEFFKDVIAR